MKKCKVIDGKYKGREGRATLPNEYNNVMFYPKGGEPFRVTLKKEEIKYL